MQSIRERLGLLQEPSQRKLRLFAVACCREIWPLFKDQRSRQAVQVAEAYADGLATSQELTAVADAAWAAAWTAVADAAWAAFHAAAHAADATHAAVWASADHQQMESKQHLLFDDIFAVSKKLIVSSSVQQMAQNLYVTKDFAALPILADYLEEHECQDQEVLAHCRSGLLHVRGCWALDAILGKH